MIREGKALLDIETAPLISSKLEVFYNPHMRLNRDISLLIMNTLGDSIKVADLLGATGVRLIRALKELENVKIVVYNDSKPQAVQKFMEFLKLNHLDSERVEIYSEDAVILARRLRDLDYLDLDPFGSPVPFLESFLFPVKRHGVLAVTATDTSALSGTHPKACIRKYASKPLLEAEFYHEIGLRILIKKVVEEGAKHEYAFKPIFSYSYRHHMRVFFRKDLGAKRVDELLSRIGYLLYCSFCLYREGVNLESIRSVCPHCGERLHVAGPMWLGELYDRELVEDLWINRGKVELAPETVKLLRTIREESSINSLGFYTVDRIAKAFYIHQMPPMDKFIKLFEGVRTHFSPQGFRTPLSHREFLERLCKL